MNPDRATYSIPHVSYWRLFLRFLKFGLLAWGGPVAQIAMLRQELVDEEKWISSERFHRVLAVYQVLPGPEAHELCVYFGMMARGRIGGLLAGLGFMSPGFLLMFALSWFYVTYGINSMVFTAVFYGFQAAVAALIVRAVHRIASHALHDRWLWGIAVAGGLAKFSDVNFLLVLAAGGVIYAFVQRGWMVESTHMILFFPVTIVVMAIGAPSILELFGYGLRAG
ncbi:MAG TPA: chromate transporter, partial [Anaerolineales bacterium]|nr:chromate transporter [Anaerolineales bacterium]